MQPTQQNTDAAASLLLIMPDGQHRHFILNLDTILIGRVPSCTIPLKFAGVSREHAKIEIHDGEATVQDLGSRNGTTLNGTRLASEPVRLRDGDRIEIADIQIHFLVVQSDRDEEIQALARDTEVAARMGTALTEGSFGTLVVENPELVDSPGSSY